MLDQFKQLTEINKIALEFFIKCRKRSEKAQTYLRQRLSQETIVQYHIGYAPRTGLHKWLERHNVRLYQAQQLGLLGVNSKIEPYQVFKNRIIIPVVHAGVIVGFGGRTLEEDQVKYINSKTSKLYQKKEILFNLHYARRHIAQCGYALLVEGYFDVLGLVDHGIRNVVAACGSAFSVEQALLLQRYAKKVYTFFDGDAAGVAAAAKAKMVLRSVGIYNGRIMLPHGYDPDTYVAKHGKRALKNLKVIV